MSSPAIFILGVGCIINNWFSEWVCSYLGVAQHLWVAGVVPSFVVYHMCDRSRLKSAARALFRFSADLRTLVSILSVGLIALVSVHFKLALWMLLAMAGCIYFLVMSFSAEKTMYIGDWCGAVAKQVFREVMMNFICEVAWMKMKGEWHFCSPYSRHLEVKSTDHYYTLKKPALIDSSNATSYEEEEEFTVCFPIEECEMFCKFQYLMNRRNGIEQDGPNKVEVSLLYKRNPLEEYTYLNVPMIRVARLKRLITILKDEGNLVLSNVHENVGSELNLAHARCYEFEEMLKLVLSDGWTLKKINLGAEYMCSISGSSFPRGTATGLMLGLVCCVICTLGKLSLSGSATVFTVAIFIICNRGGGRHCKVVEEIKTGSSSLAESNFVCNCRGGRHCKVVEDIKTGSSSLAESNSVVRHVQDFQAWSGDKGRPLVLDNGLKRAGKLFTSEQY